MKSTPYHGTWLLLIFATQCFCQGSLIVANKNENTISIISLLQGKQLKKIEVGIGPHEVAVSPNGKLATVANYGNKQTISNSLTVIDIVRKIKVKEINLGEYTRPHGIEFINEEDVLVTSEAKKVLLKVNIKTNAISEVAKTDQLASHMVAYSKRNKKAYVANIFSGTVSVINVAKNKLIKNLEFKKGIEGITVSPDGKEVWVANRDDSTVIATSTRTFKTLGVMPAHQVAYRIKYLPNAKYVMVSNGISGNMSVYDAKTKKHLQDIDLKDTSRSISEAEPNMPVPVGFAVSTDSNYVFVSLSGYDQVAVIRTKNWKVENLISTGSGPDGIYYSPINVD